MSHTESGSSESGLRRSPRLVGKFGLRRSPRLLGKSAMPMLKRSQLSPRKRPAKGKSATPMPKRSQLSPRKRPAKDSDDIDDELTCPSSPDIETVMRSGRVHEAQHFRRNYTYRDDCREKKTCIHPGGAFSWEDNSTGFTWVAIHGRDAICVVFKRTLEHVKDRLRPYLQGNAQGITLNLFGLSVISDIEGLAVLPRESCQSVVRGERIDEPFAIVSVDPSNATGLVKKDDELSVVEYFKGILKKGTALYRAGTHEAAIYAFQLLFNQKFEAEDIWVAESCFGEHEDLPDIAIRCRLAKINNTDEYKAHVAASGRVEFRGSWLPPTTPCSASEAISSAIF